MAGPVPDRPVHSSLSAMQVARPARGAVALRWSQTLALVQAGCVAQVAACRLPPIESGTATYYVGYCPSPGAQALRIEVEAYRTDDDDPGRITVTVNLAGALASGAWLQANDLDGGATIEVPARVFARSRAKREGFVDLSGVTRGGAPSTSRYIKIECVDTTSNTQGLCRIVVSEVPSATYAPAEAPTTEVSLDPSWPQYDQAIAEGGSGDGRGLRRVWSELDNARAKLRRHLQIVRPDLEPLVVSGSSFADLHAGEFRTQPRNLYATTEPNLYRPFAYYRTTGGFDAELRFAVTPEGYSATNTDYTLPDSASFAFWVGGSDLELPTYGDDGWTNFEPQARSADPGGTVEIASWGLLENES